MQYPIQDALRGGERYVGTLAVSQLGDLVQYYLQASLAASTKRTYAAGQMRHSSFCRHTQVAPLLTLEATLCKFVASLAHDNLKHRHKNIFVSCKELADHTRQGDPIQ